MLPGGHPSFDGGQISADRVRSAHTSQSREPNKKNFFFQGTDEMMTIFSNFSPIFGEKNWRWSLKQMS
jgi:hypothetical protein